MMTDSIYFSRVQINPEIKHKYARTKCKDHSIGNPHQTDFETAI